MKSRIIALPLAILSLLLTSCFEESTVVKIKKDGSGIVHTRTYTNIGGGLGLLGGMDLEGAETESSTNIPSEEELQAKAKEMGDGVTFKAVKEGKNKAGWAGYEVIYEFTDVNTLTVSAGTSDLNDKMAMDAEPAEEAEKADDLISFKLNGDTLAITTPDPSKGGKAKAEETEEEATGNPFGDDAAGGSIGDMGAMAMMAPMLKGAKIGLFVEIEGGIKQTNAKHQNGNFLTILKMDLGALLANPETMGELEAVDGATREEAQAAADKTAGVDLDLQETITVTFK